MSRADRAHNAFANARYDRFLGSATDEPIEVRAHRDARFHFHTDAILSDAVDGLPAHIRTGGIDHFRIDTGAHGFENGLAGPFGSQIDGASAIEIERNASLVCRN